MSLEPLVVWAFIVATMILVSGAIVAMFFGVSVDEPEEIPFVGHRNIHRVIAALLIPVSVGFPLILRENTRSLYFGLAFSAVTLLMAVRIWFGDKAKWATWIAAVILAGFFASAAMLSPVS